MCEEMLVSHSIAALCFLYIWRLMQCNRPIGLQLLHLMLANDPSIGLPNYAVPTSVPLNEGVPVFRPSHGDARGPCRLYLVW